MSKCRILAAYARRNSNQDMEAIRSCSGLWLSSVALCQVQRGWVWTVVWAIFHFSEYLYAIHGSSVSYLYVVHTKDFLLGAQVQYKYFPWKKWHASQLVSYMTARVGDGVLLTYPELFPDFAVHYILGASKMPFALERVNVPTWDYVGTVVSNDGRGNACMYKYTTTVVGRSSCRYRMVAEKEKIKTSELMEWRGATSINQGKCTSNEELTQQVAGQVKNQVWTRVGVGEARMTKWSESMDDCVEFGVTSDSAKWMGWKRIFGKR